METVETMGGIEDELIKKGYQPLRVDKIEQTLREDVWYDAIGVNPGSLNSSRIMGPGRTLIEFIRGPLSEGLDWHYKERNENGESS